MTGAHSTLRVYGKPPSEKSRSLGGQRFRPSSRPAGGADCARGSPEEKPRPSSPSTRRFPIDGQPIVHGDSLEQLNHCGALPSHQGPGAVSDQSNRRKGNLAHPGEGYKRKGMC